MDVPTGGRSARRGRGRGRSRGRASEEEPEEEGSPEQDDVTEVDVAGVILDLDSIEVAAVAEAEIAAAAADTDPAEADCDAESDSEDELDETQTGVDESWAELPSDELSMNDASDAMAALDVSLVTEGEGVGPAGDDGFELFDIERAHEALRSAELGVSASFQKERAESVASEAEAQQTSAEFLSRRSCVLWGEAAVPALELLHRIQ